MQAEPVNPAKSVAGIFHEPSPNGEVAPPPESALPGIPAMPASFVPPAHDEHLRSDAERGADGVA